MAQPTFPTLAQSVLIILLGTLTFVGLILGLPFVVAQYMPEYESWVLDNMPRLISGLVLILMTGGLLWSYRGLGTYKRGDDPLAMARMMVSFGAKRMAIRYLESVPRDHSRAAQVQAQVHKLRLET